MVKKIKKNLKSEELITKLTEAENNYKRVLADYQNQERRFKESQSQIISMANATLIEKILPTLDSLELAQSHLNDKGLKMVINQFLTTLKQEGLEEIISDNQEFDPINMDCTEIVPGPKNIVMETTNKGYLLSGKVIRPAKTKVGSGENIPENKHNK